MDDVTAPVKSGFIAGLFLTKARQQENSIIPERLPKQLQ